MLAYTSRLIFDAIGFLMFQFYRMFGSEENRILFKNRIIHQIERQLRIIYFKMFNVVSGALGWDIRTPSDKELGTLLLDVVDKTRTWWESRSKYMEPYAEFEEWMVAKIYARDIVAVKYVGSYRETIGSMHYSETASDIDMMYIYRDFNLSESNSKHNEIQVIHSGTPGYVLFKGNCTKDELASIFGNIVKRGEFAESLHVLKLTEHFKNYVLSTKDNSGCYYLRADQFRYIHAEFNRARFTNWMQFEQKGPASTIVWNVAGLAQRLMLNQLDIVFCVHCDEWPSQASNWLTRKRKFNYPGEDLISKIKSYGIDIVPKSSFKIQNGSTSIIKWFHTQDVDVGEEKYQLEWRLSFSVAEVMLVHSWNAVQKSCFRTVKTLRHDYLVQFGITSYSLKNIMLYMIEDTDEDFWINNNIIIILNEFLKRLMSCCRSKVCSHYFVVENNLFSGIDEEMLKEAASQCQYIINNWYSVIYLSDGLWFEIKRCGFVDYFHSLSCDKTKARWYHERENHLRAKEIVHYEGTFKVYYSFKTHKKTSEFLKKSYKNDNYTPIVALSAMESYIFSKKGLAMNAEQHVLFPQICWACIKCLRYHMTKQTDRDVTDYCKKLIEKIFVIIQGNGDTSKRIVASDLFLQGKIAESSLLFGTLDSFSATEEILSKDIAPVMISDLDARMLENLTDFTFKETAFYCPSSLVHALVKLSQGAGRRKDISKLLERASDLCDFPYGLQQIQRYKTIMIPLAEHLHDKLKDKLHSSN